MCFMAMGECSGVDMVTDELQKVIDEYNKITQEKKNWQTLLKRKIEKERGAGRFNLKQAK